MRIALLGGVFDPPHIGHYIVASQVKEIFNMNEVWFVPCKKYNPLFHKIMSSENHRFQMVKLIENKTIKVSNVELKREGFSYMIDTLDILSKQNPHNEFNLIIGSDQLKGFHMWKNWEEIIKKHRLIIFPRDTHVSYLEKRVRKGLKLKYIPDNIKLINSPDLIIANISSTKIRERIKKGLSIKYLVDLKVEKYISEHSLYEK